MSITFIRVEDISHRSRPRDASSPMAFACPKLYVALNTIRTTDTNLPRRTVPRSNITVNAQQALHQETMSDILLNGISMLCTFFCHNSVKILFRSQI